MNVSLDYGHNSITLNISDKNYLGALNPKDIEELANPIAEVKRALANPIGSKKLKEIVPPKGKIVILVSDVSRPCPSYILLPTIIEELKEAGGK